MHFISTSPVASIPEQFHGIKQIIEYAVCLVASSMVLNY